MNQKRNYKLICQREAFLNVLDALWIVEIPVISG
jgi:hypothetical protein